MRVEAPPQVMQLGVHAWVFRLGIRQRQSGAPFRLCYIGRRIKPWGVDLLAAILGELCDSSQLRDTRRDAATDDEPTMPTGKSMAKLANWNQSTEVKLNSSVARCWDSSSSLRYSCS